MKLLSKKLLLLLTTVVLLLPVIGIAQPGGPGGGGSPDEPLDNPVVPINSGMTLVFLAVAVVFAFVMFKKLQKKNAAAKH